MNTKLVLGFACLAMLSSACSTAKKPESVTSIPTNTKNERVCESGQITTLKQDISVRTKDQAAVLVKAGTQVHIIEKKASDTKVSYKIYVGQNQAGQMVSGLGDIDETKDMGAQEAVLACQKPAKQS
jgi:hypothetical protein